MYTPGPSEDELKVIGLLAEDVVDNSVVEVWPENELALSAFFAMQSQWNVGPGGPVGLIYASLDSVYRALQVKKKQIPDLFRSIRIMESEALKQMSKK